MFSVGVGVQLVIDSSSVQVVVLRRHGRGGLLGCLLVGSSFVRSFAASSRERG